MPEIASEKITGVVKFKEDPRTFLLLGNWEFGRMLAQHKKWTTTFLTSQASFPNEAKELISKYKQLNIAFIELFDDASIIEVL